MNWYKHYIGDYQRCTNRLTIRQDGVYRRLLDEYYATEQPLPTDHQECYRAVRAMTPDEQADVDLVLTRYFDRLSDGYHNKKCDEMIAKAEAQATTNRRIAKQRTVTKPSNEPSNEPLHDQPTYQTPDTRHQTKEPPIAPQGGKRVSRDNLDHDFETWWLAYPRRTGKGHAEKAYTTARKITDAATLLAGAERYAADKRGEDSRYIKHPRTWLNGKCWLDEPERLDGSKTTGRRVANTEAQRKSDNAAILAACGFGDEMAGDMGGTTVPRTGGHSGDVPGSDRGGSGCGAGAADTGYGGSAGGGAPQAAGLLPGVRDERAGGFKTAAGDLGGTPVGHSGRPAADGGEPHDGGLEVPDAAETGGPAGERGAGLGCAAEAVTSGPDGAAESEVSRMPPIPDFLRRTA